MNFLRIFPILGVRDMDAALGFYRDVLGFAVTWQWGTPPSRVGVARGGIELQLLSDARLRPAAPGQVYIHMTSPRPRRWIPCGIDDWHWRWLTIWRKS